VVKFAPMYFPRQISRCLRLAVPIVFWSCVPAAKLSAAAQKSAVLIGIDVYNPKGKPAAKDTSPLVRRVAARGNWSAWTFPDLRGAVKDVELMLGILSSDKLGFRDIAVLTNEDATANAILAALQRKLIDETAKGDIRVVYYSGHGGTVRNESSNERYKLDQTIVPADHYKGDVPDIRDKELSRILWKAGKKGVKVIFIADSCHSGGLSRGAWNARGMTRTARGAPAPDTNPYPVLLNDPPDKDESGKEINPIDVGVVFLAAAQDDEPAQENPDTPEGQHGAFTWDLKKALEQGLDQPADLVVRRATSLLKTDGFAQQPDLRGKDLHSINLFGLPASAVSSTTAIVDSVDSGGKIVLRGGKAIGIYEGCELKRILNQGGPVEIRITSSLDLARSEAKRIEGDAGIGKGDIFEIDKWVIPDNPMLSVYMPPAAPAENVFSVASEIGKLSGDKTLRWIGDSTETTPGQVMHWDGREWVLEKYPAAGPRVSLGTSPTAGQVRARLDRNANFLLILPPTTALAEELKFRPTGNGSQASSIRVLAQPGGDQYRLIGRASKSGVEYAWVQIDATEERVRQMAMEKSAADRLPLPLRTDWVGLVGLPESVTRAGSDLTGKAFRLGRLRAWLTLLAPPEGSEPLAQFPWHLAFREAGKGKGGLVNNNEMRGGLRYKMYLRASGDEIRQGVPDRWVYIFAIDRFGKGTLLFPALGEGNAGNLFPRKKDGTKDIHSEIQVTENRDYDFEVSEPYGVDTYFLLTSKQPIEDPRIFDFDGVRTKGATRGIGYQDRLTQLLSGIGTSTTRGIKGNPAVPVSWGLEKMPILSVAK
jgi:hypothetical protein